MSVLNEHGIEVELVVCPTGLHGGGEVIADKYERGGAGCGGCDAKLVRLEDAPEAAIDAAKAVAGAFSERKAAAVGAIPVTVLAAPAEEPSAPAVETPPSDLSPTAPAVAPSEPPAAAETTAETIESAAEETSATA